jgi:hypothetical protein
MLIDSGFRPDTTLQLSDFFVEFRFSQYVNRKNLLFNSQPLALADVYDIITKFIDKPAF